MAPARPTTAAARERATRAEISATAQRPLVAWRQMLVRLSKLRPSSLLLPLCFLLGSCGGHKGEVVAAPAKAADSAQLPTDITAKQATLVVVVVLDQLSSEALATFAPYLSKDGVIQRAINTGLYNEHVRYDYAGTNTAPGHASIFTGELPRDHGIDGNDLYDYESAKKISIVVDNTHLVFGDERDSASPHRLLRPTVGDLLHQSNPESKVVALSLKARSAVVMGGKTANMALWYDSNQGKITTSSYYADAMPAWLNEWNAANPVDARLTDWTTERGDIYEKIVGPDDSPGECSWNTIGTTFPHVLRDSKRPLKTFISTPQSAEYLCDLAEASVEEFDLGRDATPDLLAISISSTDYAGHCYGWQSWEFADVLYKTDLRLGQLIRKLEENAEVSVVITSDHGGTPLPERLLAAGRVSGRVDARELVTKLESLADRKLGKGNWLQAYIQPYLWLHKDARTSDKRAQLLELIAEYPASDPAVHLAVATELIRTWNDSEDEMQRDLAHSVAEATDAVFIVPTEGFITSSNAAELGTGHGTPWSWDRQVPLLAFGSGVAKAHTEETTEQNRVAATIADMLGLAWPLPAPSFLAKPQP